MAFFYKSGKAPNASDRETKELSLYLERELGLISQGLAEFSYVKFKELFVEPEKPRDGMMVYADGIHWDPGSGAGHYGRVNGAWVSAATGGARFSVHKNGTNQTGIADITPTDVTWSTEVYDIGGYFASNAWTPPAGTVHLACTLAFSGSMAGSGLIAVEIMKEGVLFKRNQAPNSGANVSITIDDVASGTDTYSVRGYVDLSAGTGTILGATTHSYFMGHML